MHTVTISLRFWTNETVILAFKGHVGKCPKQTHLTCNCCLRCSYFEIERGKNPLKISLYVLRDIQLHFASPHFESNKTNILTIKGHVMSQTIPFEKTHCLLNDCIIKYTLQSFSFFTFTVTNMFCLTVCSAQ